jgi:multimeric flavodoxin WrbA
MKATIIVGSAREAGNTELQCESVADALTEQGFKVQIIKPAKMNIHHCNGCNECVGENRCCIHDDMDIIYKAFEDSDLFILATPVYFSGPSSILKQVIDRFQSYWMSVDEPMTNKYVALLCNGGSRNPRFENVISIGRAFAFGVRSNWAGECTVPATDDSDISKVAKPAYNFGIELADKLKGLF